MRRFNLAQSSLNTIAKRYSSDMAQNYVKRITLFKVPKSEHVDEARKIRKIELGMRILTPTIGASGV
jgi:orotidine-5'-phosphate decarboxylase